MDPGEYNELKEHPKDASESAQAAIRSYLNTYPDHQELFRAAKDPKLGGNGGAAGSD